jgi:hypothetical protein
MMDKLPELGGRSHGGGGRNSQARRQALRNSADCLFKTERGAENEGSGSISIQKKSCSPGLSSGKDLFKSMSFRSFRYWFACSIIAVVAVSATESGMAAMLDLNLPGADASNVLPVPEPSRAFLLFAGIMAMAFTYRRAWLGWKRNEQP